MLPNADDADEAAQDAALRAWRHRHSLRDDQLRAAWVTTIARNAALDYSSRRKRVREVEWVEDIVAPTASYDDPALSATLDQLAFERLLAPLGEDDRALLALRYVEDLAYAEIAQRLGQPVGTIKVRLHRLRPRLKTLIEERHKRA